MTLPPVLPVGTSVVTRLPVAGHPAGAVAVIVRSPPDPKHAYRVRFPDGTEATLTRGGLTVRRHEKNALPETERDFTPSEPPTAYQAEHGHLVRELEEARGTTHLPADVPEDVARAVSDWVVRVRLEQDGR